MPAASNAETISPAVVPLVRGFGDERLVGLNVGVAELAGLAIDNGVVVNQSLETATAGVFAAGDVASAYNPRCGRRIRVEHWANARVQGAVAGRAMAGRPAVNDGMPFFFSDQWQVLFIQGGGQGAHDEWDNNLVDDLRWQVGVGYEVRYPRMPAEDDPSYPSWSKAIRREMAARVAVVEEIGS